ncbi:MAG: thiamine-phosphate kinase [Desulfobulbus propionicus]|nr:MAG: thiamine-phosphate kinase [Desulfobulbus propionicus]
MNEREIIQHIASLADLSDTSVVQGIGDDCAVIKKDSSSVWLLTMDTLIEGVHFDRSWHPPDLLGRKTVSVNISDIAAMGGQPRCILLSLGMPQGFDDQWFAAFSRGVAEASRQYGCFLAGGDTVHSPNGYTFTVTAIGEALQNQVVYRSGAQAGDLIWVSGLLGNAAAGLELCRNKITKKPEYEELLQAHLNPAARVDVGQQLAKCGVVHAMMDMSDGVATDLAHLCRQSQLGATVRTELLPLSSALLAASQELQLSAEHLALTGGEDYELLFAVSPQHVSTIEHIARKGELAFCCIGQFEEGKEVSLVAENGAKRSISDGGFDHFKSPSPLSSSSR